jgi:hypothetical protein
MFNLNHQSNSGRPAHGVGVSHSPQFLHAAKALPVWRTMPYRSVEVSFPEGSCFQVRAADLAIKAASHIQIPGTEPMTHLLVQVLPIVRERPEFLLEVAAHLSWDELSELACDAFWRSPCAVLAEHFRTKARLTLHA